MDIEQAKKAVGKELRGGGISEKVNRYIGKFYQRQIKNERILAKVKGNHGEYTVSLKLDERHLDFNCRRLNEMANTYSSVFYHIVFSTKNRERLINTEIENRVWAYIGGIARKHKLTALQVGGIDDHIHALVLSPPTFAPSQIAQFLKGESSKWVHEEFPKLRFFAWQDGYGIFSVSKSKVPNVVDYIKN